MKRVGMIGGLSYESTSQYYLDINKKAMKRLGGYNQLEIILISVNFDEVMYHANRSDWHKICYIFINAALRLEKMGAEFIIIPCNSFHIVADKVQQAIDVPLLNIIDCVGNDIKKRNYSKVALIGTKFTMENEFYRERLLKKFNIATEIPNDKDRNELHDIIFNELCHGMFHNTSKNFIRTLCEELHSKSGCEAVILGCTELPMILRPKDTSVPLILTTDLHADCVVDFSIEKSPSINGLPIHAVVQTPGGACDYSRVL